MEMSDFVPNNFHLQEVFIFLFQSQRKAAEVRTKNSKKFPYKHFQVKQLAVIGSVASNTVVSMLSNAGLKEGQKLSKTLNWRFCLKKIGAKRNKSLPQKYYLPKEPFSSDSWRLG